MKLQNERHCEGRHDCASCDTLEWPAAIPCNGEWYPLTNAASYLGCVWYYVGVWKRSVRYILVSRRARVGDE